MPHVSLILVTWNASKTIERCLEALKHQTFRDWELILIDNGSQDDTISRIQKASLDAAGIPTTLLPQSENLGFARAVNLGARKAQGTWLATLNPDAYPAMDWLEVLVEATQHHPGYALFGSLQIDAKNPARMDGCGDVYHGLGIAWRGGYQQPVETISLDPREVFGPCAAAALYRRDLFERLGGFDETFFCYHEDVDLAFRARLQGARAAQISRARVLHEGSAATGRRSAFSVYHGTRNRVRTFIKNMPGLMMWVLLPFHLLINILLLVRAVKFGTAGAYWRGLTDGFFRSPEAWKARGPCQATRTEPAASLAASMTWSLRALIKRAPDLRPLKNRIQERG